VKGRGCRGGVEDMGAETNFKNEGSITSLFLILSWALSSDSPLVAAFV
jgi:hypothetical protein